MGHENYESVSSSSYQALGSLSKILSAKDTATSMGRPSCTNSPLEGVMGVSSSGEAAAFLYSTKRYTPYPIITKPTSINKKFITFKRHSQNPLHAILYSNYGAIPCILYTLQPNLFFLNYYSTQPLVFLQSKSPYSVNTQEI